MKLPPAFIADSSNDDQCAHGYAYEFDQLADVRDAAEIAHVHVQSWLTTYKGLVPEEYLASLNETERIPLWQEWLAQDISVLQLKLKAQQLDSTVGSHS